MSKKVLLLNASEEILNVIPWRDAATLVYQGKAKRPYGHDESYEIKTATGVFVLPTAIVLIKYVRVPYKRAAVNKENVLKRDGYECQYCGKRLTNATGTIDHVYPRSKGGKHTWSNVVAACSPCNNVKDDFTLDECNMKLRCRPFVPTAEMVTMTAVDIRTNQSWTRWVFV